MKKSAADYFMGPERYNCAQAVLKGFQEECDVSDACIHAHKKHGNGKAPEGVCGSAFAAMQLLATDEERTQFKTAFKKEAGSLLCKEIRARNTMSCKDTVSGAERIVQELKAKRH